MVPGKCEDSAVPDILLQRVTVTLLSSTPCFQVDWKRRKAHKRVRGRPLQARLEVAFTLQQPELKYLAGHMLLQGRLGKEEKG